MFYLSPPFVQVQFVGVVPPSGELDLVASAPTVGPGFDVVHAMNQPLLVGATMRLGDGALTVVLDDVY